MNIVVQYAECSGRWVSDYSLGRFGTGRAIVVNCDYSSGSRFYAVYNVREAGKKEGKKETMAMGSSGTRSQSRGGMSNDDPCHVRVTGPLTTTNIRHNGGHRLHFRGVQFSRGFLAFALLHFRQGPKHPSPRCMIIYLTTLEPYA
jgi:hypothetical protein